MLRRAVRLAEIWLTWKIVQEAAYLIAVVLSVVFVAWAWWQVSMTAGRVFRLW